MPDDFAMLVAARDDRLDGLIRLLARPGADPDTRNPRGTTALMAASRAHQRRAVAALLAAGARLDTEDERGMTPFHFAALGADCGVLEQLHATGADPCHTTPSGFTALMLTVVDWDATRKHPTRPWAMRWLCAHGVDVNAGNRDGSTALHLTRDPDMIQVLIELGAAVNAADAEGATALLRVVEFGGLVRRGADVNAVDCDGSTPLMIAAATNRDDTVRELLTRGANRTPTDRHGHTALEIARARGAPAIVAALEP